MNVTLLPPEGRSSIPELDPEQQAALDAILTGTGHHVVVGTPGSGKTSVVAAVARQAVRDGVRPERLLVLAPTRMAAASLRDTVSAAVDVPTGVPVARTAASVAHAILASRASARNQPAPSLITGADQDALLRDILAGHRAGDGRVPDWTGVVPDEATALPGFRHELRDLLMRATEAGAGPEDLRRWARETGRREWVAAANVMDDYLDNLWLRTLPGDQGLKYDPASVAREAAFALDTWSDDDGPEPSWDLVIIDDYHDATAAVIAMVKAIATRGARLVLVGNADESVQGYRGAVPSALADATQDVANGGFGATLSKLTHPHRQAIALHGVTDAIVEHIGTQSVGSARVPARPSTDAPVDIIVAPHRYAQSRAIAAALRRARQQGSEGKPMPWSTMAVIARSNRLLRDVRSDILGADIPCASLGDGVALHEHGAIAPLLTMMSLASSGDEWTEDDVTMILSSRLVGLDPVALRRLRRGLVREERAGGGTRSSAELLTAAMAAPEMWASVQGAECRAAERASRAVAAARHAIREESAGPRRVIWTLWTVLEVVDRWREHALAGSARDDADLDAVMALLREAQNFEERMPAAGARPFINHLESQDFAVDSLGARAQGVDAVEFVTPASAAGREWDVVVVVGVEEGVWPNLRLRDSVLGSQHLAEIIGGRATPELLTAQRRTHIAASSRKVIADDEARSFAVAVSRARRQLVLTCVEDEETRPSRFVDWVESAAGVQREHAGTVPYVADLRHVVARLRADGATAESEDRARYAQALARLSIRGVPWAHPRTWHGVPEQSTTTGYFPHADAVRVSPSRVEGVERCTLRWALESAGGVGADSDKQQLGTLIHEIAQTLPAGSHEELSAELDRRWPEIAGTETLPDKQLRTKADAMVRRLADYFMKNPVDEVLLEQRFSVTIGDAELAGSADRVERLGEAVTIVDLKTGDPTYSGDVATHAQLSMYQLAAAHHAFAGVEKASGAALAFVGGSKVGSTRHAQEAIDIPEQEQRLERIVDAMRAPQFLAVENDMCGMCPVRRSCPIQPEGTQVSGA
ncbi:UrvD/REP family ATP-dependent DNA helicase [Demequina sediminicola]|uniref:UrvD/REP family ATP-dependent DNA helicase n=1 Tax=Demequina sediminicola TaxID=1095026 RepID=UPI000783C041|nr:UrvD/REP family ATP-dependent DNA helicase [Demequina sediminicola]